MFLRKKNNKTIPNEKYKWNFSSQIKNSKMFKRNKKYNKLFLESGMQHCSQ